MYIRTASLFSAGCEQYQELQSDVIRAKTTTTSTFVQKAYCPMWFHLLPCRHRL